MPKPTRPRTNSHRQSGSISSTGGIPSHSYNNNFSLNDSLDSGYGTPPIIPQRSEIPMSPSSRNLRNLKVLHRHDPTIHTVIDQFSLATMYELSLATQEWENVGCEGPLFIFERSQEPKLGYIVLNRVGLEDYFHYFDASDLFEKTDNFLICRVSRPPAPKRIFGIWTQGEGNEKNPMKRLAETFIRINQCLKRDIPFTYSESALPNAAANAHHNSQQVSESEAMSKLLFKLGATSQPAPVQQQQTRNNSVPPSGDTTPLAAKSALAPPLSGASLLSSIFASALPSSQAQSSTAIQEQTPPNPTPPPPPPIPSEVAHMEPYSPRPQILTPGIIDAIMGVSPSRASNSTESDSNVGLGLGLGLTAILKQNREPEREGLTPTPAASSTPFEGKDGSLPSGTSRNNHVAHSTPPRPSMKDRAESKRNKHPQQHKGRTLIPFEDESELWPYSRNSNGKPVPSMKKRNGEDWSYDADADAEDQNSVGRQGSPQFVNSFPKALYGEKAATTNAHSNNRRKRDPTPIWDEVITRPNGLPVQSSPSPGPAFGIGNSGQRRKRREKAKEQYIPHNSPPTLDTNNLPKGRDMGKAQLQQILASSFLTISAAKSSCDEASDKLCPHPNRQTNKMTNTVRCPESKNEFVRELLGLIHTDKDFVDELWEKYRRLAARNN